MPFWSSTGSVLVLLFYKKNNTPNMLHRTWIISTLLLGFFFTGQAQNEWVDLIVGRPDAYALEARQEVAKTWGIRYRYELAGCIACAETRSQAQALAAKNNPYFQELERRYGTDWRNYFNQEVLQRQNFLQQQNQPNNQVWYEVVTGRPDMHYFNTKKEVAASWGINYEPIFIAKGITGAAKEEVTAKANQSYAYEEQLSQRLGEDWYAWITEQTEWQLAKSRNPQKGQWQDPIWGDPDSLYYQAKADVARAWNINYVPLYLGTRRLDTNPTLNTLHTNGQYFAYLQQHFGEDWWQHFYRDVAKAYWSRRLQE